VLWYAPEMALPTSIWVGGAINLEAWTRQFVNRPLTMRLISPQAPSELVCTDPTGAPAPCALLTTPTFWLRTTSAGSRGFVAVAEVGNRRWSKTGNTLTAVTGSDSRPLVYVEDPAISGAGGPLPFAVNMVSATPAGPAQARAVPARGLQILRRGSGWALVELAPQPPFVASSIGVTFT